MLLTVSIKLITNQEQKQALLASMHQFNAACNWISQYCFEQKVFSKIKVQKVIYYELREKFNLPAQFAIRAISRVAETYKTDKTIQHTFKKTSSVEYDARILNWKKLDTISILSLSGRLSIPIVFGQYAKLNERVIRNSAKLIYRKKHFYLQAAVETPEQQIKSTSKFLGIDLGIVNIATLSTNKTYTSEQTNKVRKRYNKLRATLQSVGTKSAKRHLKQSSKKERNFKKNTNHLISKHIVQVAQKAQMGIAIEDLQGFKKTVRREQREQFGKWAFGELANFIEYKAQIAGVPVIRVSPRDTSRICSNCGYCDKNNRKTQSDFVCKKCGYSLNADYNASINIANRAKQYLDLTEALMAFFSKDYTRWAIVNSPIVAIKKQPPN